MKILVVNSSCGRGGITRIAETLFPALAKLNPDITFLGQTFNESGRRIAYPPSAPFIQIYPTSGLPPHPDQFHFLEWRAQEMADHLKEVEKDYDLIFIFTPWWIMSAPVWTIMKPVVTYVPDFAFDHIDQGKYLTDHFRKTALLIRDRSDHVIFCSQFQRQWGEDHYGFKQTSVIPYSIDFVPPAVQSPTEPDLPERFVLAFHCADKHKDPETILRAYAEARKQADIPPLVIAGIGTERFLDLGEKDHFVRWIRRIIFMLELEIGKDLFVLGTVPEGWILPLYQRAVCAIVASRSEGNLSGGIYEAIRYQTPLIWSDFPVFTEHLKEWIHGHQFKIGDWERLSHLIVRAVEHPIAAEINAERAYRDFSTRSMADVANDFLRVFKDVLTKKELHDAPNQL